MFDMAYLKKLCLLYVPDLEEYAASERKLYFDVRELPFPAIPDNDALEHAIQSFDPAQYKAQLDAFLQKIGSYEQGTACRQIYENILRSNGQS